MNLTNILKCLECGQPVERGQNDSLICREHGEIPVVRKVPSFVTDSDPDKVHFDWHWNANKGNRPPQMKIETAREFLQPLFDYIEDKSNVLVVDAGSGDGIHAAVFDDKYPEKIQYVGVDISMAAIASSRSVSRAKNLYVHADVTNLPIVDDVFDVAFSFGVLTLTPDPEKAFSEMCRVVKEGGLVGLWVYPDFGGIRRFAFNALRFCCRLIGTRGTVLIANMLVPVFGLLPTRSGLHLGNSTWREIREVILVNVAPQRLQLVTTAEISMWFEKNGIDIKETNAQMPVTIWGIKKSGK